jgi:hypothetical protein
VGVGLESARAVFSWVHRQPCVLYQLSENSNSLNFGNCQTIEDLNPPRVSKGIRLDDKCPAPPVFSNYFPVMKKWQKNTTPFPFLKGIFGVVRFAVRLLTYP